MVATYCRQIINFKIANIIYYIDKNPLEKMYTGYDEKHLCKKQHGINYQVSEQRDAALSMTLACLINDVSL